MELSIKEFPFVLVDRELRGLKSSYVGTDNREGSYRGITSLINKGHRNILYLSSPVRNTSVLEDRLEGARAAFDAQDIPILESRFLTDFHSTRPESRSLAYVDIDKKILFDYFSREKGITALFACEYDLA
jgi:GntR family transcriptional regulator of arabinose operon